jgi:hypothetical protein
VLPGPHQSNTSSPHIFLASFVVVAAGFISRLGRTGAFNLSVSAWVPCGIMLTSLACTMGRDEDAMQVGLLCLPGAAVYTAANIPLK